MAADATDDKLIAAHLTAGLLSQLPIDKQPNLHAVSLYFSVLDHLRTESSKRDEAESQKGVSEFLNAHR